MKTKCNYWGNKPPKKPSPFQGLIGEKPLPKNTKLKIIHHEAKEREIKIHLTYEKVPAKFLGFENRKIQSKRVKSNGGCIA